MNSVPTHYNAQPSMVCPCCVPKMWHHSPYATNSQFIDYGAVTTMPQHDHIPYFPSVDMGDTGVDEFPVSLAAAQTPATQQEATVHFERKLVLWGDRWHMVRGKPALESFWSIHDVECLSDLTAVYAKYYAADVAVNTSLHIFQKGVEPTYADPRNSRGGHFTIRIGDVASADGMWQYVATELAFCRLPYAKKITGVSLIRKPKYMCLQIWVNDSRKQSILDAIRESLLAALANGRPLKIKFSPHRHLLDSIAETAAVPARQMPQQGQFQQANVPATFQQIPAFPAPFTGQNQNLAPRLSVKPPAAEQRQVHRRQIEEYTHERTLSASSSSSDAAASVCASPVSQSQAAPPARPLCAFFYKGPANQQGSSVPLNTFPVLG